jgi:ribosomal protein S6
MKTYELTYIVTPEITSEEAEAFAKELESFIAGKEGVVIKQASPIAKTLSYQIKKHASGFVGSIEFQLEPEALLELKEKMAKDKKVNRHMIVIKYPARKEKVRRSRNKTEDGIVAEKEAPKEITIESKKVVEEKPVIEEKKEEVIKEEPKKETKKVELKDIEEKLEELLGE